MGKNRGILKNSLIVFVFFAISFPQFVFAMEEEAVITPKIVINEMMIYGSSSSTADEWIELKNLTEELIDISGYNLFDEVRGEVMLTIPDNKIAPNGYFLFSNNSQDHIFSSGESVLAIEPDFIDSNLSLSNSAFQVSLRDSEGETVDLVGNGKKPFFSAEKIKYFSIERLNYNSGLEEADWKMSESPQNLDDGVIDLASPQNSGKPIIKDFALSSDVFILSSENKYNINFKNANPYSDITYEIYRQDELLFEKQIISNQIILEELNFCPKMNITFHSESGLTTSFSIVLNCYELNNQIFLSEIMPRPNSDWNKDGITNTGDEWIEVVNLGKQINLSGWKLSDESGKEYKIDEQIINKDSYLVFFKSQTKIALNDDGDRVDLIDPTGKVVDSILVPSASKSTNYSYVFSKQQWQWTTTPTLKGINMITRIIEKPKTVPKPSIPKQAEPKKEENNKEIEKISPPLPQELLSEIQEIEIIEKKVTTKSISTIKTTYYPILKTNNYFSAGNNTKVLGSFDVQERRSSNFMVFMVYLSGLASFILIISLYEICCRE